VLGESSVQAGTTILITTIESADRFKMTETVLGQIPSHSTGLTVKLRRRTFVSLCVHFHSLFFFFKTLDPRGTLLRPGSTGNSELCCGPCRSKQSNQLSAGYYIYAACGSTATISLDFSTMPDSPPSCADETQILSLKRRIAVLEEQNAELRMPTASEKTTYVNIFDLVIC